MFSWSAIELLSLKPLVTLLALVNPLASIPFFIHITQGFDAAQRKKTIRITSLSVLVVLVVCALLGLRILAFFGISLASFQVGGGALLLMSAINMLNARPAEAKTSVDEASYAVTHASVAVVPLAIPMLTGPASMSTMVIFADRTQNMLQMAQLLLYAALVAKRPRGRPKADATKVFTAIRLDADLLQAFKATGKGWQTRVNAALRQYIAEHPIG